MHKRAREHIEIVFFEKFTKNQKLKSNKKITYVERFYELSKNYWNNDKLYERLHKIKAEKIKRYILARQVRKERYAKSLNKTYEKVKEHKKFLDMDKEIATLWETEKKVLLMPTTSVRILEL